MEHTSHIEISRSALKENFAYLRKTVGEKCIISHVVKGNAYGHGISSYVPLAMELGADHFATFDAYEALQVLEVGGKDITLMIMGMIENEQLEWAIENEVEFYVFEFDRLRAAIAAAKKVGKKALVHVELETGMNRTGFEPGTHKELWEIIKSNAEHITVKGLCTHYAGAENYANFIRIFRQLEAFQEQVKNLEQKGIRAEMLHTASSASAIRLASTRMDMVRIGILQYGFWPSRETYITTVQPHPSRQVNPLKRLITWKSRIMSIKHVKQGEYVGYGTSYMADYDMKVALVPVGYAHGYSRTLSNIGRAIVRGKRVSVAGTVNMNMMMLDVNALDNVEKGDEVVLIGDQGGTTISVSSFSEYSDQLNYELLTRLPSDIPRTVVD